MTQICQNSFIPLLVFFLSFFVVVTITINVIVNTLYTCFCAGISVGLIPRRKYPLFKGRGSKIRKTDYLGQSRSSHLVCMPPNAGHVLHLPHFLPLWGFSGRAVNGLLEPAKGAAEYTRQPTSAANI